MVFRWLQSKMKAERSELEAETHVDTAQVEFGPVPWTVWFDSGLVVYVDKGPDEGLAVTVDHAFLVLGRTREHGTRRPGWLLIADSTISRRQAVMVWNSEARTFIMYHLEGATNRTHVGRKPGASWSVGPGSLVHVGRMRMQIQQRPPQTEFSPFAGSALGLLERKASKLGPPPRDLALTIINGPQQGCTYLLTRHFHVLHRVEPNEEGHGVLRMDSCPELEQAVMGWNSAQSCYQIVHNPVAEHPTRVYRASAENRKPAAIFSAPEGEALAVTSKDPLALHYGDVIELGDLQMRLHPYVNALLDGSIRHILSKGYIEEIPSPDRLLANVAEIAEETVTAPPQQRKLGATVEKTEQLETPSMKAKLERLRASEAAMSPSAASVQAAAPPEGTPEDPGAAQPAAALTEVVAPVADVSSPGDVEESAAEIPAAPAEAVESAAEIPAAAAEAVESAAEIPAAAAEAVESAAEIPAAAAEAVESAAEVPAAAAEVAADEPTKEGPAEVFVSSDAPVREDAALSTEPPTPPRAGRVLELPPRASRSSLPGPRPETALPVPPPPQTSLPTPRRVLELPVRKTRSAEPAPAESTAATPAESTAAAPAESREARPAPQVSSPASPPGDEAGTGEAIAEVFPVPAEGKPVRRARSKKADTVEMPAPTAAEEAALAHLSEPSDATDDGADADRAARTRKKSVEDEATKTPAARKGRKKP